MSDLIETHSTCPICGMQVSLTEKGNMRKTPKHTNCIGNSKNHGMVKICLNELSIIDNIDNQKIPSTEEATKKLFISVLTRNLGSKIALVFPDIPGEDYRKLRHSKFSKLQKDRYSRDHADEIVTNFRQALASSRAAMGTSKEP